MKYNKVFIMSNVGATGGTELLHQLAFKLNKLGLPTYMVYSKPVAGSTVEKAFFKKYEVKVADKIEESPENLIIMPENIIKYLPLYKNIQKAAWWLSVDNYSGARRGKCNTFRYILRLLLDIYISFFDKKWIHFVQSEYARLYVTKDRRISDSIVFPLSDYLNSAFIESNKDVTFKGRKNIILFNPKKGFDVTKELMTMLPEYNWVPIQGMTPTQICDLMRESKLYIDFGNHPGKDRLPREAAICGCCIITGRRGAASNNIDIMIPEKYKFEDHRYDLIVEGIKSIMNSYEDIASDFNSYREKIINEEAVFDKEIKNIFFNK